MELTCRGFKNKLSLRYSSTRAKGMPVIWQLFRLFQRPEPKHLKCFQVTMTFDYISYVNQRTSYMVKRSETGRLNVAAFETLASDTYA